MKVLKCKIYTNELLTSKKNFMPKFKKMVLSYCELFDEFILKVK